MRIFLVSQSMSNIMATELDVQTTEEADVGRKRQEARKLLVSYLNKRMRVFLSDGRVIIGNFLCTDRDCNIVLGSCEEYLSQEDLGKLLY